MTGWPPAAGAVSAAAGTSFGVTNVSERFSAWGSVYPGRINKHFLGQTFTQLPHWTQSKRLMVQVPRARSTARAPGSRREDSLLRRRAQGADVRMVYSPIDALEMAGKHPDRQVVFAGVGFETTAPGTAACLMEARERRMSNFSVLSLLKTTEPAVRALVDAPQMRECRIDGFLCPGHVAVITGADSFAFLPEEYGLPAVVSGFEPEDLVVSVYLLVKMLAEGRPALVNEYARLVRGSGNPAARKAVDAVFAPGGSLWRGLGEISESGLAIREEFAAWDAARQYGFCPDAGAEAAGCRCGDVIRGLLAPQECPLFGRACLPEDPVGPCMVSGEGACAAAYRYRE